MKVNVNKPVPVVTPPPTYDIIGLTAVEAKVLYDILNCGSGRAKDGTALAGLLGNPAKSRIRAALYSAGVGQL